MADLNLTPVQEKVDQLRSGLFRATPTQLAGFIRRHEGRLHPEEVSCIAFAYKAINTDSDDLDTTQALWDEWNELHTPLLYALPLTDRAQELHTMTDSIVEAKYCGA
mgnify:CR=1 FL=1